MWWHRLLCFLRLRDDLDYGPPIGPEVPHPYMPHVATMAARPGQQPVTLRCCEHCGAGQKHAIHRPPYDNTRLAKIFGPSSDIADVQIGRVNLRLGPLPAGLQDDAEPDTPSPQAVKEALYKVSGESDRYWG